MSIKKLFNKGKTNKVVKSTDLKSLESSIESERNLEQRFKDIEQNIPHVDFSNPENFARYGSAEKYYTDAIDRIVRSFPYDGSDAEISEFHNESNYVDRYIFDNLYPRTTGYATFSPHDTTNDNGGWGANDTSPAAATLYYGEPTTKEYIEVKGGPHSASYGMPSGSLGLTFTGSNKYSTDIYSQAGKSPIGRDGTRESNLRMDPDDGVTIEFWLKKESFIASKTQKEVIFDLWNQVTSSDTRHGRLTVELTASGYAEDGANPFRFTFVSGAIANGAGEGFQNLALGGTAITTASIADNKWHHYALSVYKTGSNNTVRFYRDGELVSTLATGSTTSAVTGSLVGFIGALQTHPNLPVGTTIPSDSMVGWGKLSASIDEFRYWKTRRTSEQIKKNFYTQVRGGSNNEVSNADLGVYYKFNEGVTTETSIDSTVLDYSGRISNGIWVGYASDARSTGSAIVEYSGSNKIEYKDPIIYGTHPDVQELRNNLIASASYHDVRNNSSLYGSMPEWITDEDKEKGGELKHLTQVIGNYFDTLHLQIEALSHLHDVTYQTSSGKPLPFANSLLESKGFINSEIFANADVLEAVKNRDTERDFEEDMHKVKNLIYKNIYNNLVHIYKTKGTEKSFRNLIRCFGIDEEVVRINLYSDNTTHLLKNRYKPKALKRNFIDFYKSDNQDALVTHQSSSQAGGAKNSDSIGVTYLSASHKDIATTAETEVIFPRLKEPGDPGYVELSFTDSSIFGWDQADADPDDYIKPTNGSGYQVLAIRPNYDSKNAYFKLVDRRNGNTIATSSLYKDVYDDQRWTFALRTRNVLTSSTGGGAGNPSATHGHIGTYLTGGPGDGGVGTHVEVNLYGVHTVYDRVQQEFALSGNAIHSDITVPRRYYVGARRTNVTGALQEYSGVKVGYLRHWQMYLDNKAIQAHSKDPENYGTSNPMRSSYLLENPLTGTWMPEYETLALNWDFSNVTGSDADGEFTVQDFSSGSIGTRRYRDPDIAPIVSNQYNARGYFFATSTTGAVDTNYVSVARQQRPEVLGSQDMIEIRSEDDLVFTKDAAPISHYFTFEKSLYQTISEEMLNMFAGIAEFNNLIGEPVNKYRHEYKDMAKLRQLFYEKVENVPDLDKYLSYYKWLDTALGEMLQQLVPASSRFSDDVRNVIEDTILTRNKYRHKIPTIRALDIEVEGRVKGIYENTYRWSKGHAPIPTKAIATITVADGDAASGMTEKEHITIVSTDGTTKRYVITNAASDGATATGTVLSDSGNTDTGAGTAGADEDGGIAVSINLSSATQNEFLVQLKAAIEHANGHNGKIAVSAVPGQADGNQAITLTQDRAGPAGNRAISDNISQATIVSFTGGDDKQNANCLWWKQRAERQGNIITSDKASVDRSATVVSIIDEQRNTYKKVGYSFVSSSVPKFSVVPEGTGLGTAGVNNVLAYTGSYYYNNRFTKLYRLYAEVGALGSSIGLAQLDLDGDGASGKYTYWQGATTNLDQAILITNLSELNPCTAGEYYPVDGTYPAYSTTEESDTAIGGTTEASPTNNTSILPFGLYTTSVTTGYVGAISNVQITDFTGSTSAGGLALNDMHRDVYETNEIPAQGPFTEKYVGGWPHRHVDLNTSKAGSIDSLTNRLEGFKITFTSTSVSVESQDSDKPNGTLALYRNTKVKSPVNIRNIQQLTGSGQLNHIGNFSRHYEIIQTSDRDINNRAFVKHEGKGPFLENSRVKRKARGTLTVSTRGMAGLGEFKDVAKPNFYLSGSSHRENNIVSQGSNQFTHNNTTDYVIVERFSAPGGPETAGDSMGGAALDFGSAQYSPYNNINYRNLTVRLPLRRLLTDHANQFGLKSDASTAEWNAAADAHDAYNPSTVSSFDYSGIPAFHDVNRNSTLRYESSGSRTAAETVIRAQTHDNYWVSREIPQSDTQYAWITASLTHIPGHQTVVLGHPRPDGMHSSSVAFTYALAQGPLGGLASTAKTVGPGFIPAYNFVSASDAVSKKDGVWLGPGGNVSHAIAGGIDKRSANSTCPNNFFPTDFVGMNGNLRQIIDTGSLILSGAGSPYHDALPQIGTAPFYQAIYLYVNTVYGSTTGDFITSLANEARGGNVAVLNALNLNRNGPYGWPSWKQIRTGETRVGRYLRRNNIISYNETPGSHSVTENFETIARFGGLKKYREPALVSAYSPIKFKLGMKASYTDVGNTATSTGLMNAEATYGNELVFFSDKELDDAKGFIKSQPIGYKTITDFYLRGGLENPSSPVESFVECTYKEMVYPREANTYMDKSRKRNSYANNFWRDNEEDRRALGKKKTNFIGTTADSLDEATGLAHRGPGSKRSSWNLDGLLLKTTSTGSEDYTATLTGSEVGILQDYSAILHHGSKNLLTASCIYARPHLMAATSSLRNRTGPDLSYTGSANLGSAHFPHGRMKIYGGITRWEAGAQAGVINDEGIFVNRPTAPFYDSYDDYADDLRSIAKDYSIVPEFRISEHIEFYMNEKQGNFLAPNPKLLSIFGCPTGSSVPQNSSEDEFFKVYSTSDFMKHFAEIKDDHKEIANPTEITLTCKAAMKFLPYNGFYPAERTVEIATQFSKSYGQYVLSTGDDTGNEQARMRPLIAPLFAPGVLFNTIKSGIAVDYPMYTGSYKRSRPGTQDIYMIATASHARHDSGGKLAGWDIRVPFESLASPEQYLTEIPFHDLEVHPSAALDVTASWTGLGDGLYKMMANNFLAEVPEFFLPSGEFSTLKSSPQSTFNSFDTGSVYGMRIKLRKSYNKGRGETAFTKTGGGFHYPQDHWTDFDFGATLLRETFTMYSRPSAFGPPVSGRHPIDVNQDYGEASNARVDIGDSLMGVNPSFTPPYYDGEAWCDILFRPSSSFVTLSDILADSRKIYWRFDRLGETTVQQLGAGVGSNNTHPYGNNNINNFSMQLSSSFNLFQEVKQPTTTFDKKGNPITVSTGEEGESVWVIQPKFETPMFNFSTTGSHPITNAAGNLNLPVNNSESISIGMWHQFGVIPTDPSKGIFLELADIPELFRSVRVPNYVSGSLGSGLDTNSHKYDDLNYQGYYNVSGTVLSLLEMVDFPERTMKLGRTAQSKRVSEAVVAVPFIEEAGARVFFNVDRKLVTDAIENPATTTAGESIKSMIAAMRKYVVPPTMDFLAFPGQVDPISMYFFEFEYDFTQDDLVHMWQNLMPPSGKIVKMAEAKVSHSLLLNEIFGNVATATGEPINDKLKWMVFKVKQKAKKNYYSKVAGAQVNIDPRYSFTFNVGGSTEATILQSELSYNWPYDNFSLVEMIKLESEVKFAPLSQETDPALVNPSNAQIIASGVQANTGSAVKQAPTIPTGKN